jgi:glutamine amidotransferase-like uncharacterized protein
MGQHQLRHDLAMRSDVRTITVEGLAYAPWSLEVSAFLTPGGGGSPWKRECDQA